MRRTRGQGGDRTGHSRYKVLHGYKLRLQRFWQTLRHNLYDSYDRIGTGRQRARSKTNGARQVRRVEVAHLWRTTQDGASRLKFVSTSCGPHGAAT